MDPGLPKLARLFRELRKPYHTVLYLAKLRLSHWLLPVVTMLVPKYDHPDPKRVSQSPGDRTLVGLDIKKSLEFKNESPGKARFNIELPEPV